MAVDIGVAILGKISEYLVAPIGRQLGYVVQFSCNVETLENQLEKLGDLKDTIQQEVNVAKNNVETILKNVETWLDRVSLVAGEAQGILEEKARTPEGCLNIKSRYALGRRVKKITLDIVELQKEGIFPKVSLPAPPIPYVVSTSTTTDSREVILNDIIKHLKNEDINMIGICGMGGVGKTTLVNKVYESVMKENMFEDYAQIAVSQKADLTKIQKDIADMLGLKLEETSLNARASRLNQRLEGKKVLIILDDIWEQFDLHALGINLQGGQRKCKIVFTSRNRRLWLEFRSKRCELSLDTLPYNESWNLFKEKIEDFLDEKPEFVPLAEQIVRECAGLPLALVTIGSALLGQDIHTWNDTLTKLKAKSGVDETVYVCLRQSYDHLGNEEAKSLLLLCSLFEEDSPIPVENLVSMAMGLQLFNGINSIEAARDRVFTLVGRLQSRSLVFANSDDRNYIRIHDLVRDVSKSIACREKGALVLEHGDTFEKSQGQSLPENSIWISVISKEVRELPSSLQFPRLELLRCNSKELQIPDSCFEGMVRLRVVDLIFPYRLFKPHTLLKLPLSLQSLTSLHTLCLRNCTLDDYTAIKYLQSLEILRIADNYEYIEELPQEIGHLTNLMLLDMSDCKKLKRISPGIISGLTKLEELYLGGLEIDWGVEETEQGGNASLGEFDSLSNLHILHIMIKDSRMLPNTLLFGNLKKYQIQIGDAESYFIRNSPKYEKISSISSVALNKNINFLLHKSEALLLMGESTKSLVNELVREASQNIKCLEIRETETPEYLFNAIDSSKAPFLVSTLESLTLYKVNNLQQIIKSPLVSGNFANIEKISVQKCEQIRNIFELSTTREEDATKKLQFLKLKTLKIADVPLECFCKGANEIIFHQLEELTLKNLEVECIISVPDENPLTSIFPHKVSFPSLKKMGLYDLNNMKEIWCVQLQTGSFNNLSELKIIGCGSLQYVFSACMTKHLVHLHTLSVFDCNGLTEIVHGPLVAGSLVNLKVLKVRKCNQLRNTFKLSTAVDILHLERMEVDGCESMEEIISWEGETQDVTSKLQFPELRSLFITCVENLKCFCKGANEIEFHQLYNLTLWGLLAVECLVSISDDTTLKSFFPHKVSFPSVELMKLDDLKNMKEIWCGQLQAGSFSNLSALNIEKCGSLQYVFSACMAKHLVHLHTLSVFDCDGLTEIVQGPVVAGSLVNLKELTVRKCNQLRNTFQLSAAVDILQLEELCVNDCGSMEEIISWEGETQDVTSKLQFPELRSLEIELENIKCFCKGANEIEFHSLYDLTLVGVQSVVCLISISDETTMKSFFPHKVSFPRLGFMWLSDLRNMKAIWCGLPKGGSYYNLSELIIYGCDSLEYVFSFCMASYLVHLRKLEIKECMSLKEVVSIKKEVDGLKEEDYTSSSILPKLEYVFLIRLQALERFCHTADDLEFPELNDVRVVDSPKFETFAHGFVHTPNLNHVKLYEHTCFNIKAEETLWKGSLNSTLQHLQRGMKEGVSLFELSSTVDIVHLEEIKIGWRHRGMKEVIRWEGIEEDATRTLQFPKLKVLKIADVPLECFCKGANEIIFHQLEELTLWDLEVECIISVPDENPLTSIFPHKVSFPRLKNMELLLLKNMEAIWCGQPKGGSFSNLSELIIYGCDSLENIFSPCMASYLVHLRILEIMRCRSLKEVVAIKKEVDVQKEEDYTSSSILPKLESVILDGLEALERFCHIADDLEFPELNNVRIVDCPEFETFAPGFVHTPNLNHVLSKKETLWKGNLNSTIKHLHEEEQRKKEKREEGGGEGKGKGKGEGEGEGKRGLSQ